jgi:hypothetical protein
MTRAGRFLCRAIAVACAIGASAAPVWAQNAGAARPAQAAADPRRQVFIGGSFAGPTSAGSADALLLGGDGSPGVVLFHTSNRVAFAAGPELGLAFRLRPAVWLEVAGAFAAGRANMRITDDFEDAADTTITGALSRIAAEGAVRWHLRAGASSWFVRAGAGAMRESAGGFAAGQFGLIGSGGIGFVRWSAARGRTTTRTGFRFDARAVIRVNGLGMGSAKVQVGPAAHFSFLIGY